MDKYSNQQPNKEGKFFVIEGIDGCGKDTQIEQVSKELSKMGYKVYITNEPSYTGIGALIRESLKNGLKDMNPKALSLLYIADRINHCDDMRKYKEEGYIVISSRYFWSNLAYNTDGTPIEMERLLNKNLSEGIMIPDGLIYLDISAEESIRRMSKSREELDAFENIEKQRKVHDNYQLAINEPIPFMGSTFVVDGTSSKDDITNSIVSHIVAQMSKS